MTQFPAVQRIDLTSFSLGVLAELIGRGVGPATVALEASGVAGLFVPGEVLAASKALPTEVTTHRKFCSRGCDECHSTSQKTPGCAKGVLHKTPRLVCNQHDG